MTLVNRDLSGAARGTLAELAQFAGGLPTAVPMPA